MSRIILSRRDFSLVVLAAMLLIVLGIYITAAADSSVNESLHAKLDEIMRSPTYGHSFWGILVKDVDSNQTLLAINPDKMFVPASDLSE